MFDCDVGHSMCIRCYVSYIEDALNNRRFKENRQYGYTIQCPGMQMARIHYIVLWVLFPPAGCEGSEIKEIHHFRIMGPKNVRIYKCIVHICYACFSNY